MRLFYDLHIHTALSPCADDDMTPNNIVNMAALAGLDIIAITDHNETGNARACIEAARRNALPLVVVPGMELETAEEIHVVCLFAEPGDAERFGAFVREKSAKIPNRPDIFGEQLYMDKDDQITGKRDELLLAATRMTIEEAFRAVPEHGGFAFPAHVDRDSYSVLGALGMIPPELGARVVEISKRVDAAAFFVEKQPLLGGAAAYLSSSDAHSLPALSDAENWLNLPEKSAPALIRYLKNL